MYRFGVIAALLLSFPASAQIVLGPPRPLTAHVGTGPVPAYASRPVAASSGDQFLVAWNDTRLFVLLYDSYTSVQATRVSASGEVLDPTGLRFPLDSGSVIGIGSSGLDYLVVTTRGLFIVSRDGNVTRGDKWFAEDYPVYVVSNGTDYVVSSSNGYFSYRVDRSGHFLDSFDRPIRLAVGRNYVSIDAQSRVSVIAPDGTITQFTASTGGGLVAAAAGDDEIALLVRTKADRIVRFRLNGTQIGPSIPVVLPVPLDQEQGTIGWNGTSYVVLYTGAYCFAGAARDDAVIPEALPYATTAGAIASSPHGALAVWADARFATNKDFPRRQIVALPLLPGANPASARDVVVSLSDHAQVSPRIDTIGGRQLVAFIEQSGAGDAIVVVPANGGDDVLRIAGTGSVHGLRAATDGNEWFLLWSEDTDAFNAAFRAAIVTPALQATRFDIGKGQSWDEPNVMWTGSEYLVYGGDFQGAAFGLRFARGGTPLPPPFPFAIDGLGVAPAVALLDGRFYMIYAFPRFPPFDAASPWYEISNVVPYPTSSYNNSFFENDEFGTAPAIAAAGGQMVAVTQSTALTFRKAADTGGFLRHAVASTLAPHVVARDGAFLVTAAEMIAWMRGDDVLASATLPDSAGVELPPYQYPRRVLESIAPATGPLTIAYVTSAVDARTNGTARIWLRDILPQHHRAAAH